MKKNIKKLALLIAALTVSSALASTASATIVFKNKNPEKCPVCGSVVDICDTKTPAAPVKNEKSPVKTPVKDKAVDIKTSADNENGISSIIWTTGNSKVTTTPEKRKFVFTSPSKGNVSVKPSKNPVKYYYGCDLIGGKYFTPDEASELLEDYFDKNSHELYFYEGDKQAICDGAYFYSTDSSVVYYDYKTGKLVANGNGNAEVYVYTTGGIPFFRLDVSVYRKDSVKKNVTLDVIADDWNLSAGEETTFTVTASDGKVYDDIRYTIWYGSENATVTQISGKLSAKNNGAVVVHAYSESKPSISGDALVYIGDIAGAVADGYWSSIEGGIRVDGWKDDICDYYYTQNSIKGWIKSAEGILIPVIKFEEATVNKGGELTETTILTGGKYSLADLIKEAYGDKDKLVDLINKYNLAKYGIYTEKDCYSYLDCYLKGEDYIYGVADTDDVLSAIIKGIIG